jgi:TetR/AcrR family transcriptional regulator
MPSDAAAEPAAPAPAPRRLGRPRRDGRRAVGDPIDEILAAAARLFGELGVGGTTMARIASEVGLRQASVYYYFRGRDEVAAALVARANVVPLELVERIEADGGSSPAKLLRFVRGDVEALCALPFDINEIHRMAARDRDGFAGYWDERHRLEQHLARIVRSGVRAGELRAVKPKLTALTIMANDEGVQNWYRLGTPTRPAEIGRALAELTVAGLVAPTVRLADVVAEVAALER